MNTVPRLAPDLAVPTRGSPLKRAALALYGAFDAAYVRVLGRPALQKLNLRLLQTTLRARGYNNLADHRQSGEEWFIRHLARLRPRLCLDVGANVGQYSAKLLAVTDAEVWAFEPMPRSFRRLAELGERWRGRFHALECAVGATDGEARIRYGAEDSQLASLAEHVGEVDYVGRSNVNEAWVRVRRLDGLVASGDLPIAGREIDLLKIDTEGYELEVLAGASDTLANLRPKFVQLEFNWHQLFCGQSLWRFSTLLPGYRPYQLLPNGTGWHAVDPRASVANVYCFANFVFVRDDVALEPGA